MSRYITNQYAQIGGVDNPPRYPLAPSPALGSPFNGKWGSQADIEVGVSRGRSWIGIPPHPSQADNYQFSHFSHSPSTSCPKTTANEQHNDTLTSTRPNYNALTGLETQTKGVADIESIQPWKSNPASYTVRDQGTKLKQLPHCCEQETSVEAGDEMGSRRRTSGEHARHFLSKLKGRHSQDEAETHSGQGADHQKVAKQ